MSRISSLPLLLLGALVAPASAGDEPPPAQVTEKLPPPVCAVRLQFGYRITQHVEIEDDRVKGADYNLHIEDHVTYGFVSGHPTRFRLEDKHISGNAGGKDLMLNVARTETSTVVSGLVGGQRVVATVSAHRVTVKAHHGTLYLSRDRGNHLSGRMGLSTDLAPAHLTTYGCGLASIRKRPELIVVLFMWWLGG